MAQYRGCFVFKADILRLHKQVKADRGEIETDNWAFQVMQEWTGHLSNWTGPVNKT